MFLVSKFIPFSAYDLLERDWSICVTGHLLLSLPFLGHVLIQTKVNYQLLVMTKLDLFCCV